MSDTSLRDDAVWFPLTEWQLGLTEDDLPIAVFTALGSTGEKAQQVYGDSQQLRMIAEMYREAADFIDMTHEVGWEEALEKMNEEADDEGMSLSFSDVTEFLKEEGPNEQ